LDWSCDLVVRTHGEVLNGLEWWVVAVNKKGSSERQRGEKGYFSQVTAWHGMARQGMDMDKGKKPNSEKT
jgi:hypothetical protein